MKPLYQAISREAIVSVKAEQVMGFLDKEMPPRSRGELDSGLPPASKAHASNIAWARTRSRCMTNLVAYLASRPPVTTFSFFKHDRKAEHRDGHATRELASFKKSIYNLIDLRDILLDCNRRYLEFLSALNDFSADKRNLDKLTMPKNVDGHRVK